MPYVGWRDFETRLKFADVQDFDKVELTPDKDIQQAEHEGPPQEEVSQDNASSSQKSIGTSESLKLAPFEDDQSSIPFRLLIGAPRLASLRDTPIPYSQEFLTDLTLRWQLPSQLLQCARSEEATFVPFGRTTLDSDQNVASFIFATPSGRYGRFTLAIAYNIQTGCTRGVLLDGRLVEIHDFKDHIKSLSHYSRHPLLAPIVLLEACGRMLTSRIHKLNKNIGKTRSDEYMMKAQAPSLGQPYRHQYENPKSSKSAVGKWFTKTAPISSVGENQDKSSPESDYSHRTTFFNHISAEAGFSELRIKSVLHLLAGIRAYNKFLDSLLKAEPSHTLHSDSAFLGSRIDFLVDQMQHLLFRAQFIQQKAQIQISAVYNLIAQKDSLINIEIAADSRALANTALRHSSAMKTIAVLTTIFLPGTFVATFFAMPLFNWDAPSNSSVTKERFGWYFAVTIPATVLTICIWQGWIIYHERAERIARQLFQRIKTVDESSDDKIAASEDEGVDPAPPVPTQRDISRFKNWKNKSERGRYRMNELRHKRGLSSTDEESAYSDEDLGYYGNRLRKEDREARAVIREARRKTKRDLKGKSNSTPPFPGRNWLPIANEFGFYFSGLVVFEYPLCKWAEITNDRTKSVDLFYTFSDIRN